MIHCTRWISQIFTEIYIQMQMNTFNTTTVKNQVDEQRFFTIDVTANTAEHQALLKQYGLFGPPGIFKLGKDGQRSAPLLGFVGADELIEKIKYEQWNGELPTVTGSTPIISLEP